MKNGSNWLRRREGSWEVPNDRYFALSKYFLWFSIRMRVNGCDSAWDLRRSSFKQVNLFTLFSQKLTNFLVVAHRTWTLEISNLWIHQILINFFFDFLSPPKIIFISKTSRNPLSNSNFWARPKLSTREWWKVPMVKL